MIMNLNMLLSWCESNSKKAIHSIDVIVSPLKQIDREYRFFVVESRIITGSLYKMGGKPFLSSEIPEDVAKYVESIIDKWLPSPSVVIDVGLIRNPFRKTPNKYLYRV